MHFKWGDGAPVSIRKEKHVDKMGLFREIGFANTDNVLCYFAGFDSHFQRRPARLFREKSFVN
jgi:hypothetical protein